MLQGLVIGCGSIGERHLFNLKKFGIKNLGIYDEDIKKMDQLAKKYKVMKFKNLDDALNNAPNFSVICTPPTSHVNIANKCIKLESHVFIEKPISNDLVGTSKLLKQAHIKNLSVAVGYNMRFDESLNHIRKRLFANQCGNLLSVLCQWGNNIRNWSHPNYLNHYVLRKGGGIIFDDSHEYDYLRWLLDDEVISVYCKTQKLKNIKTETESLASIILEFKRGTIGTLIIDYVRAKYERSCHIIGEKGSIKWSFMRPNKTKQNYKTEGLRQVTIQRISSEENQTAIFADELNRTYVLEMKDFLDSIKNKRKPRVDGWEGINTLKIGLAAHESARKGIPIRIS